MIQKEWISQEIEKMEKIILATQVRNPGESADIMAALYRKSALIFCLEQNENTIKQRISELQGLVLTAEPMHLEDMFYLMRNTIHYHTMKEIFEN